ncbi:hypothetical protein EZV73_19960 [Acidaminobacter sp. JC074]|uniref:hypothetical protein n=1 Tax=Acidaminobacter sp. JC074 TaxID=2530199 RepID=UPI001F0FA0B3|nr:hypothetical protein [Acidaminobacter sp. JC074]MCH4889867.1 hypothetical protein [Acidaminobacter sp. JC074]
MEKEKTMYTQTEVLNLGFSKKLISSLLPDPLLKTNPVYRSAAPLKLFNVTDVEEAMQTEAFKMHIVGAAERKARAKKAVETKRRKFQAEIDLKIKYIRVRKVDNVIARAVSAQQSWYYEKGYFESYAESADDETKERWAVNFIRHNLTEYEYNLYTMKGKVGKSEGYTKYKHAVLDKIAEYYPEFREECIRQKNHVRHEFIY